MVHEHDTQGALLFVERLNQSGTDYNQFMKDLLSYLRDMYVVKHTADTPPSIALSEEQLDALRAQANRVPIVRTVTFIDLLGEALRAVRQGSDPRLELELALIKMTAFGPGGSPRTETEAVTATPAPERPPAKPAPAKPTKTRAPTPPAPAAATSAPLDRADDPGFGEETPVFSSDRTDETVSEPASTVTHVGTIQADIDHLKRAWPVVLDAVKRRQAGLSAVLGEGRPDSLEGDELIVKFPAGYGFQANQVSPGATTPRSSRKLSGRSRAGALRVGPEDGGRGVPGTGR